MEERGEGVMADWDPSCLEGSNCSLLCYNPHCAIHSKNTEGWSGYHRPGVCACVLGFISTLRWSFGNYAQGFTHGGFGGEWREGGWHKLGFTLWGGRGQPWKKPQTELSIRLFDFSDQPVAQAWDGQTPHTANVCGLHLRLVQLPSHYSSDVLCW